MAVQIKHNAGLVFLTKDGDTDKVFTMSEEEAIHVLGKDHPIVKECRVWNKEGKRKKIEELELQIKKLKETL